MKKFFSIIAFALLVTFAAGAQDAKTFYPGWYLGVQGGANYTTSNDWTLGHWDHINIPNAALNLGYDFTPVFGLRANLSGPFANCPGTSQNPIIRFPARERLSSICFWLGVAEASASGLMYFFRP